MRLARHFLLFLVYGIVGAAISAAAFYVAYLNARPDLKIWHVVELEQEFRTERAAQVPDMAAYLRLEDRLFKELHDKIYTRVGTGPGLLFNRYSQGSASDPETQSRNWNRSFEMKPAQVRGGALLLHGLSDSPYSMRAVAEILRRQGFLVLGLRLPGHGTAPAGLLHASWRDFAAATRLGARYLRSEIGPDKPFYIVGYSNGAALAVEYSLAGLEGEELPRPDGLLLFSPAIGVSPVAALAKWQARIAVFGELEKLAWNSIYPEYDPYKYNSFTVNAGDQIYRLTRLIERRIQRLDKGGGVPNFPRVLVFQSVVDATVNPSVLVDTLLLHLAPAEHELVLFDVNRHAEAEALLVSDPEHITRSQLTGKRPFAVTLVTNINPHSETVHALHKRALEEGVTEERLDLQWPRGVYSLSHVALPFPPDDPVYGYRTESVSSPSRMVRLGRVELRGEHGLLLFPASQLTRLRSNPLFDYVEQRVIEFVSGGTPAR